MNSVTLIGRLTKDPDVRYTGDNNAITNFTLAVDRPFSKEKVTDFHRIVAFGKLGETCGKYLEKGKRIAIQGRIQNRSFETKTGDKVQVTEIVAESMEFLDSKSSSDERPVKNTKIPEGFIEEESQYAMLDDGSDIPF